MSYNIFRHSYNIGIYILTLIFLFLGFFFNTHIFVFPAILLFVVWDLLYFTSSNGFSHRDSRELSQQVVNIRQYLSYFLPFYGVLIGILITLSPNQNGFIDLCVAAGIPFWLLIMPLIISSVSILFVPIQIFEDDKPDQPTSSLRALFVFTILSQQISIFLFLHMLILILKAIKNL